MTEDKTQVQETPTTGLFEDNSTDTVSLPEGAEYVFLTDLSPAEEAAKVLYLTEDDRAALEAALVHVLRSPFFSRQMRDRMHALLTILK